MENGDIRRLSLKLESSVRRKCLNLPYLIISESEDENLTKELNNVITPIKNRQCPNNSINTEDNYSDYTPTLQLSKSSISCTNINDGASYILSEYEEDNNNIKDRNNSLNDEYKNRSDIENYHFNEQINYLNQNTLANTQPCIQTPRKSNGRRTLNFTSIRRRKGIYNHISDSDYDESNSRPSITYLSSVKRKNKILQYLIDFESDCSDNIKLSENVRSSLCMGPELINESTSTNLIDSIIPSISTQFLTSPISNVCDIKWESPLTESVNYSTPSSNWISALDSFSSEKNMSESSISDEIENQNNNYLNDTLENQEISKNSSLSNSTSISLSNNQYSIDKIIQDKKLIDLHPKKLFNEVSKTFVRNRNVLSLKWYKIFNQRVFKNQLPLEIPIKWTGKLHKTAAQTCFITESNGKKKVLIQLSKYVLDSEYRLKKTLLHECCHVAQFIIDKCTNPPHGQIFMKWGKIATQEFPDLKVEIYHSYDIVYKFRYQCLRCLQIFGRQTKVQNKYQIVCSLCNGNVVFIGKGIINNIKRTKYQNSQNSILLNQNSNDYYNVITPTKTKKNSKISGYSNNPYAKFVKEKFQEIRTKIQENKQTPRRAPSLLKEIAILWKEEKEKKKLQDLTNQMQNISINN
ncbi:uncharacterized protein CMU_006760 [Cryptosporidium muris RN66]|uniref:SprT-like domain-containing protein n=1 Tax=Cryptosporidium muris (strain RN66) TaxID=441375 RepID=B6AHQ8_CRYMR|nr:uncharacterized protein CMU_006760 [Cryptosporidium muris RN66]EEA07753.1 hypothetical protein, conserved [Cryptosporidium muris RN66]|eukprot:XP_002142102.1 hypothetical protein [Cryptosporidium muris RN66]